MSRKILASGAAAAVAFGTFAAAAPAQADPVFTPVESDIIGVGSDTTMISMQAAADAYNVGRDSERLVSFDALVADRSETIVLTGGSAPVKRPNGSTDGKATLFGAGELKSVDYARSSSALKDAEKSAGLQLIPFAADILTMSVSSASNAPAGLSAEQIVQIYKGEITNWDQIGGRAGTIQPMIPQDGSGTRSFFLGELKKANGGVDVTLGSNVKPVQEHDPSVIRGNVNALAPFSVGRARLANATAPGSVVSLSGWRAERAVYNVVRNADDYGKYAKVFGTDGFLCSPAAKDAIEAGGLDQLASVEKGGACGTMTQDAVTNFKTADETYENTTTALKGYNNGANRVSLTATVTAGTSAVSGGVVRFYYGSKLVASKSVSRGTATVNVGGLPTNKRTFTAKFVPSTTQTYRPSSSNSVTILVKTGSATRVNQTDVTLTRYQTPKAYVSAVRTDTGSPVSGSVKLRIKKGSSGTYKWVTASKTLSRGKVTIYAPKFRSTGTWYMNYAYSGNSTVRPSSKTVRVSVR